MHLERSQAYKQPLMLLDNMWTLVPALQNDTSLTTVVKSERMCQLFSRLMRRVHLVGVVRHYSQVNAKLF